MRFAKIIFALIGFALAGICTQCSYNKWPQPPSQPDTISFNKQLIPIFTTHCALPTCHNAHYASDSPSARFDLDSAVAYYSLVTSQSARNAQYVNLSNPTYSVLYQQVYQGIMPKTGTPLTSIQISEILKWIQQGARNN